MIKKMMITGLIFFSLPVVAATTDHTQLSNDSPFYVGAYGGYGSVSGGYQQDGNFAQGRFVMGLHTPVYQQLIVGTELGFQSGNDMRLEASSAVIDTAGGLPIQATLKPVVDLLLTVKGQFKPESSVFYVVKGGIAYRQLQLENRTSSRDSLSKVNGELQIGLGYSITPQMMVTAFYQGIYGSSNADVGLDTNEDVTISSIPTQQAVFLGVEYSFS